jgi:hypothetical protein
MGICADAHLTFIKAIAPAVIHAREEPRYDLEKVGGSRFQDYGSLHKRIRGNAPPRILLSRHRRET